MDYNLKYINNKFFGILVILMIILGCVPQVGCVQQSEYDKLLAENKELKAKLEECMHGAEKLIAKVEKAYSEKKYEIARNNIKLLHEKHPESPKNEDFRQLLKIIEKNEIEEIKRKEEKEKERVRLANVNNTGMWTVRHYVDEFGEKTDDCYITNREIVIDHDKDISVFSPINGSFSNSATHNSKLTVRFLITREYISIMLYEYAGDNPVKAIGYNIDKYYVQIKDSNNEKYSMNADLQQDRLIFNKENSKTVHSVFMKGGSIMFKIEKKGNPINVYHFTIKNADWYENAYRKLNKSE